MSQHNGDSPAQWQNEEDEGIGAAGVVASTSAFVNPLEYQGHEADFEENGAMGVPVIGTIVESGRMPFAVEPSEADELKAAIRWLEEISEGGISRLVFVRSEGHARVVSRALEGK